VVRFAFFQSLAICSIMFYMGVSQWRFVTTAISLSALPAGIVFSKTEYFMDIALSLIFFTDFMFLVIVYMASIVIGICFKYMKIVNNLEFIQAGIRSIVIVGILGYIGTRTGK
jgi:hypothetical protein